MGRGTTPDGRVVEAIASSEATTAAGLPYLRPEARDVLSNNPAFEVTELAVSNPRVTQHAEVNVLEHLLRNNAVNNVEIAASRPVCMNCQQQVFNGTPTGNPFTPTPSK